MAPFLLAVPLIIFFVSQARSSVPEIRPARPTTTITTTTTTTSTSNSQVVSVDPMVDTEPVAKKGKPKKHRRRKHSSKQAKKEHASEPVPSADTSDAPGLSKAAAKKVLRSVHMLHCGGAGDAKVNVTIAPSGQVSSAGSSSQDEVASCVVDTVKSLRFPSSSEGLKTSHHYRW